MAITFPLTPADGQLHSMGGIVYVYKLTDDKWVAQSSLNSGGGTTPPVNDIYFGLASFDANTGSLLVARNDGFVGNTSIDGRYVKLSGDTMTGPLVLNADPVLPLGAATKQYVDSVVSADIHTASAVIDANTGFLIQTRTDGTTYVVNLFSNLDARYVNATGDTMTGPLTINSDLIVTGTTAVANLISSGTSTFNGPVYTNQTLYSNNVTISGDTIANTLIVNGPSTFNSNVAITKTLTANTINTTNLTSNTFTSNTINTTNLFSNTVVSNTVNTTTLTSNTVVSNTVNTTNLTSNTFTSNTINTTNLFSNNVTVSGTTIMQGNTIINGTLTANNVAITLASLTDVSVPAPTTGQVLSYNAVSGKWESVSLPAGTVDTFLSNVSFDANTRVLTTLNSDGVSHSVTITDSDNFVNAVSFDPITRLMTIARTDGATFTSTIPDADSFVNTVSFNNATRALSIVRNDGNTFTSFIPDADTNTVATNLAFNANTNVLTLTSSDASVLTANVNLTLNSLTNVEAAPTNGQVLSYNAANTTWIATTLPAGTADTFTANGVINSAGVITYTKNDLSTYTVDISTYVPTISLGDLSNVDGEADDIGSSAFLVRNPAGLWRAGGVELNQLSDVEATLPANGQVLTYNTANSTWIATTISSSGIRFSNTASTFNGVPRYSDLTGQFVKNSSVTIGDQGDLTATSVQTSSLQVEGFYRAKFTQLAAGFPTVNLDWKGTTYFFMNLATGNAPTIAFVNPPLPGYVASMTLEVLASGGTMTWPTNVKFPDGGTAPTLTSGKTYLFMLTTSNAGVTVLASTQTGYV